MLTKENGYRIHGTQVFVPELEENFLGVRVLVMSANETERAFEMARQLLRDAGIEDNAITSEYYSDAIRAMREAGDGT